MKGRGTGVPRGAGCTIKSFQKGTFGGLRRASCRSFDLEKHLRPVPGSAPPASHQMYAMQSTELIRQFLHERLGVDPQQVVSGARLADLGVDSLMLAELMFEAEDRLGIAIDSSVTAPKTVGDMVALIESLQAAKAARS